MRNDLLAQIVVASGGVVTNKDDRNALFSDWLAAASIPQVEPISVRNKILSEVLVNLGGNPPPLLSRNKMLEAIVLALGGTVTNPGDRNQLLRDCLKAIGGEVPDPTINNSVAAGYVANYFE